jgi:hypothetical protein
MLPSDCHHVDLGLELSLGRSLQIMMLIGIPHFSKPGFHGTLWWSFMVLDLDQRY